PSTWQRTHAFAWRVCGWGARRKLGRTAHGKSAARGFHVRGPRLQLLPTINFPVHTFQRRGEHLLALQGMLCGAGKAPASQGSLAARFPALGASQGPLLVAHGTQALAQRREVIKPGVVNVGMVTAQDDLTFVVAENAVLELARYRHGLLEDCPWRYAHSLSRDLVRQPCSVPPSASPLARSKGKSSKLEACRARSRAAPCLQLCF